MAESIEAPVGEGAKAKNLYDDVVKIQKLLNAITPGDGGANPPLKVDGLCGPKTKGAIQKFQLQHFGWKLADGRVDPKGVTLTTMNELASGPEYESVAFRMRRLQPDEEVVLGGRPQIFHVQYLESPGYRSAIYTFSSQPVSVDPASYPSAVFKGGWNVFTTHEPATIRGLECEARQATSLYVPPTPWGPPDDFYKIAPGHAMELYLSSGTVYTAVGFDTEVNLWGHFGYSGEAS